MKPYDTEVVILTTQAAGTPHAEALQLANPGLIVHVHAAADPVDSEARNLAWRNCDRNLREWWQVHRDEVEADRVLVIEWDTFCNVDIRGILPSIRQSAGLVAAAIRTPIADRGWIGFQEIPNLPASMQPYAIGAVPSAVLLLSRGLLDEVAFGLHDEVFESDILSELRLATVARSAGFPVTECRIWREVTTKRRALPEGFRGIAHPVKMEVSQ